MSGSCGLLYLDGRPASRQDVERMTDALAHRGPDSAGVWTGGPAGLGHRMLWTTSESLSERLPLADKTLGLAITADARLDNRQELLALLGDSRLAQEGSPDSRLVLAAYQKWGARCVEYLIGDFAFAIWDERRRLLFCTRDHYGVRPFAYHYTQGRLFAFASEVKAVLRAPGVPQRLNEVKLGYHLCQSYQDRTETFYEDVYRLPPGHCLVVSEQGLKLWQYWAPDYARELTLGSDQRYAEAFLEVFTEAVGCRLRSAFALGTQLSGGMDSSSVTAMAARLMPGGAGPLHTFSMVYDEIPASDEREYINEVLAQDGFQAHFVHPDRVSPLADAERVQWHEDGPIGSPTLYLAWTMCQAARDAGVRVMLDGLDGDTAVGHGDAYLTELARSGKWREFASVSESLGMVHKSHDADAKLLRAFALPALAEYARRGRWLRFARAVNEIHQVFGVPRAQLLSGYGLKPLMAHYLGGALSRRGADGQGVLAGSIVNQEFARRTGLEERLRALSEGRSSPPQSAREEHYRNVTSGLVTHVLEMSDRVASALGIEARHPFADVRLLELCLALPADQKLKDGYDRSVMRRAMAGVLPERVRWRPGKTRNSAAFTHSLLKYEGALLDRLMFDSLDGAAAFIDVEKTRAAYHRYRASGDAEDEMRVWTAVTAMLWLGEMGVVHRVDAKKEEGLLQGNLA